MSNSKKSKIKKSIIISRLVDMWPEVVEILEEDYGFHCVGCLYSGMETLEEGARVHGLDDSEIKVMIENLNELYLSK